MNKLYGMPSGMRLDPSLTRYKFLASHVKTDVRMKSKIKRGGNEGGGGPKPMCVTLLYSAG